MSLSVETGQAADWSEYTDEASGATYYYNTVTGETSWDNPFVQSEEPGAESSPVNEADPADVAENWMLVEDPGGNYYYNTVTQVTQWDMPACMDAPSDEPQSTGQSPVEPVIETNASPAPVPGGSDSEDFTRSRTASINAGATTNTPFSRPASGNNVAGSGDSDSGPNNADADSFLTSPTTRRKSSTASGDNRRGSVRKQYKNSVLIIDKSASLGTQVTNSGESWESLTSRVVSEADGVTAKLATLPYLHNPTYVDDILALTREHSLSLYAYKQFKFPEAADIDEAKIVVNRLLSWQQDLIKTCLCKAISTHNELVSESIFLFRHVTGYMKDRIVTVGGSQGKQAGSQHEQNIALKILELMLLTPSKELYDELYCQVCKQIANNPNMESTIRGWQLLNICLASFPPSTQLAPFIINFASQHIDGYYKSVPGKEPQLNASGSLIAKLAYNIVYFCPIAMRFPAGHMCRKELPGVMEMEALERAEGINIRTYFIDGKYTMTKINSWTTAQDVEDLISTKASLGKFKNLTEGAKLFSLYETTSVLTAPSASNHSHGHKHHHGGKHHDNRAHREEEVDSRALAGTERLMDVLSLWQRASSPQDDEDDDASTYGEDYDQEEVVRKKKNKSKHHHVGNLPIYKFVFKRKFYFGSRQLNNDYSEDYTTIELTYHEVVKDVLNGYYPYTEHDAYLLAALQLQHDEGDYDPARDSLYFKHQPHGTQVTIGEAPGTPKSGNAPVVSHHKLPISLPLLLHYVCKSFLVRPVDADEGQGQGQGQQTPSGKSTTSRHMTQAANELFLSEVVANIVNTYKRLVGMNCLQCRLMYLDYIRSWKLFGCRYFFVENQNGNASSDSGSGGSGTANQVLLAINYKCITLLEPTTKDFMTEYNYNVVLSWGYSLNSLLLVIGLSSAKQVKLYFKTLDGKLINELIDMYSKQYKASNF